MANNGAVHIEAVCNVKNVLCGPKGVARVYGPQKGATPEQVESLSQGLERYAEVIGSVLRQDISYQPGSGASGGLGAGLLLLGGTLRPRSEAINDHFEFDSLFAEEWDVVITAEGMIDKQSTQGKMTTEIARRAKGNGAQVVALAGTIGAGADACHASGIEAFSSILQAPTTLEAAIQDTPRLLKEGAERLMRTIMVGMSLRAPSPSPSPEPRTMGRSPSPRPRGRSPQPKNKDFGLALQSKLKAMALTPPSPIEKFRPLSPSRVFTF
jgi:glycerate 2-kinase